MADDEVDRRSRRRRKIETASYLVGYGRPPEEHRFKPGNPGRKTGSRNKTKEHLRDLNFFEQALADPGKKITVTSGTGVRRKVAAGNLVISGVRTAAAKGDIAAAREYRRMQEVAQRSLRSSYEDDVELVAAFKTSYPERRRWAQENGLPEPLPHPDHVELHGGRIVFRGPSNDHEKEHWDRLSLVLREFQEELPADRRRLRECTDPAERERMREYLGFCARWVRFFRWWFRTYDSARARNGHSRHEVEQALIDCGLRSADDFSGLSLPVPGHS